jgi:hypothetical protein
MDTPGVIYRVTSIPLNEYDVQYVYPQPKRTRHMCCIVLLVQNYIASYYKTNRRT